MSKLYKISEVAALGGWCHETIRRKIKAGDLEAIRIGGQYRITEKALAQFIEENSTATEVTS